MQLCEWKGGIETIWLKINKQTLQFDVQLIFISTIHNSLLREVIKKAN